jgi:hypothetical protein
MSQKASPLKNLGETRALQSAGATDFSVAWALQTDLRKKVLAIGSIAASALLVGGLALAQTAGHGGFDPPFMQGQGPGGMGPGMMQHIGPMMGKGMMYQGEGMGRPGMMHGGLGPAQFDPARIETLKTELGIATAQEPVWTKYVKSVQDAVTAMKTTREGVDPNAVSRMSQQDRFGFVITMRNQAQKHFEAVKMAADQLLATLDDAQKAKVRETLPGLAFGPGMMRGHRSTALALTAIALHGGVLWSSATPPPDPRARPTSPGPSRQRCTRNTA